jgi:hypothetical protein
MAMIQGRPSENERTAAAAMNRGWIAATSTLSCKSRPTLGQNNNIKYQWADLIIDYPHSLRNQ